MYLVYVFYLKTEMEEHSSVPPYAYTIEKSYYKLFKEQRNMDTMYLKKMKMDEIEFSVFMSKYKYQMLIQDYLSDGEIDIEMIITYDESAVLNSSIDYITDTIISLNQNLLKVPFRKKYLDSISAITNNLIRHDQNNPTLRVDTLHLFYYLFRSTFSNEDSDVVDKVFERRMNL